jgi:hypothetical protein
VQELREDVREAIELSLPDGVIEMAIDPEDSYFWDVLPKLQKALGGIPGAALRGEWAPEGEASFYLFFVAPRNQVFRYDVELDDDGMTGEGWIGCAVAVSLLAPFGVVTIGESETYRKGATTEPPIDSTEADFCRIVGQDAYQELLKLKGRVADILDKHWIGVLPREEWSKQVTWLRLGDDVLVDEPIRVLDALFFEMA